LLTTFSHNSSAEDFAKATLPLIRRDSYSAFADKIYATARRFANKEQKAYLQKEVERHNIRIKSP
jgi:hypothetical protein